MRGRSIKLRLIAFALLAAAGLALALPDREADFQVPASVADSVRSGDLLLFVGTSWRGRIVRLFNARSDFSHGGLATREAAGTFVLHADPQRGCVKEEIHALFRRCRFSDAVLLRPRTAAVAPAAVSFCERSVARHIGFNDSFRYLQGRGFYCTEFVLVAYANGGTPLLTALAGAVVFPEQLLGSPALHRL